MAESEGVRNFHLNSDVDSSKFAQHHTIGTKYGQAAPGEQFGTLKSSHEALEISHDNLEIAVSKIGKTYFTGGTASSSIPNAGAAPYTSVSGFTTTWGDPSVGLIYTGLGVFGCGEDGTYLVEVSFGLANSSAGRRIIFWYKNGTAASDQIKRLQISAAGGAGNIVKPTVFKLVNGDQLHLRFFQDSGAALNMQQAGTMHDNGSDWSRIVSITRLG